MGYGATGDRSVEYPTQPRSVTASEAVTLKPSNPTARVVAFLIPGFGWKVTGRELMAAADRVVAATAAAGEALATS